MRRKNEAGRREVDVAADSLPEHGRKWLRGMVGGGKEREGRARPPGVEGVGPGPPVRTQLGAWTPTWEGHGFLLRPGGRDPGNDPEPPGRGSSGL